MATDFNEIGRRLKAYRLGAGLQAEELAEALGVSRAAVYRIESGGVVKIEVLDRLASVLNTSVASVLGAGVEYYEKPVSYFERMRQLEEQSDQIIAHFPPLSYLLTSPSYSAYLKQTLLESVDADNDKAREEINSIVDILDERRNTRQKRRLSVVNFVNLFEIERWLKLGGVGSFELPPEEVLRRRAVARQEIEHLIALIEDQPMGIQIGLIEGALPNGTFQLFRTSEKTFLGLSPFRLGGEMPNVRTGIAMLTTDEQPVRLYEQMADDLWGRAHKGGNAVKTLRTIIERSAVDDD